MQKRKKGRKLSRKSGPRKALRNTLAGALFLKEKIKTTEAKAKEVSGFAEKSITKAKKQGINSRRFLARFFPAKIVKKLVDELAVRYKDRPGGYTRIIKLGRRKTDGAKVAIIELLK